MNETNWPTVRDPSWMSRRDSLDRLCPLCPSPQDPFPSHGSTLASEFSHPASRHGPCSAHLDHCRPQNQGILGLVSHGAGTSTLLGGRGALGADEAWRQGKADHCEGIGMRGKPAGASSGSELDQGDCLSTLDTNLALSGLTSKGKWASNWPGRGVQTGYLLILSRGRLRNDDFRGLRQNVGRSEITGRTWTSRCSEIDPGRIPSSD